MVENKDKEIITILLNNDIYIPVQPSQKSSITSKYSVIKSDCDLLDIEKNLYTNSSNDNNLTEFINKYKEDNKKSREINYKILSQIENTEKIIEGKIKDLETRKNTIIYFVRKGREIIKLSKNDYIRNIYIKIEII